MKGNRTNFVTFSRQLKPQPPKDSYPYWWGIGDLSFYKYGKTVWHQEIPEASLYFVKGFYNWLKTPRYYIYGCQVKLDKNWGWILEFQMSHEEAAKIWEIMFRDHPEIQSNYEPDKGQFFTERKQLKETIEQ
jgi:hypothetical protein